MRDYLTIPLRERAARRKKDPVNFAKYPIAVGGIFTLEGEGRVTPHNGCFASLRVHGPAHKVYSGRAINHTGWYTDHFQDNTLWGVVFRLPHGRFMAGTEDSWGNRTIYHEEGVFECDQEAALRADRVAENEAEKERDYQAKEEAERKIEENKEEIARIREELRGLCKELRPVNLSPSICEAVRFKMKTLLKEKAKLYTEIRKFSKNYWEAVA